MVYKFSDNIQKYTFSNVRSFVMDLEEVFNSKINSIYNSGVGLLNIYAPKEIIEELFYCLILQPHTIPEIITSFSLFEEYDLEELVSIFSDESNKYLNMAISEDRVIYIEETFKNNFSFDDPDGFRKFAYVHKDIPQEYVNELSKYNTPTLIFSVN